MSSQQNAPDSGAPERNEEEDEGDGRGAPRVVVLRHPLNDILGKAQLKDDAKYEVSDSGAGAGKRNHTDASLGLPVAVSPEKEAQRPSRKSRKSKVAGKGTRLLTESKKEESQDIGGTVRHALEAHSGMGSKGGNFLQKVMQLLSSDSHQELTAALLDRLLTEEKNPKNEKVGLVQKEPENLNTLFAVEGYNPPVQSNVRVIRDTKWSMGVELRNEFDEINRVVVHGEGFNDEVSSKLLGCQKQLVLKSVIGQANRDKASDHWTDLMYAINLGKKNWVAENYERLMYCLFMQECTDVLADGKLIMTNQVRQVRPDRCDAWAPQQFCHEESRGRESDASYRSGNYPSMREQGGQEVDRFGIRQGERNGMDVGGRYGSRNHGDERVNGNDNGLYRNDAAGRQLRAMLLGFRIGLMMMEDALTWR